MRARAVKMRLWTRAQRVGFLDDGFDEDARDALREVKEVNGLDSDV